MAQPPRSSHASRAERSDLLALLVGTLVGLLALLAAFLAIERSFGNAFDDLAIKSDEVALAIGEAVAEEIEHAVALGIPLDKMRGVEPHLQAMLAANPSIAGIAILDEAEDVLYAVEPGQVFDAATHMRAPISVGETRGAVLVRPSLYVVEAVREHILASALAVALLAGLAVGLALRFALLERVDLPRARFVAGGRSVARGVFADFTPPPPGPLTPLGAAAARLIGPLRRSYRRLLLVVDEVRALDTSNLLHGRIDAAMRPLRAYRFNRLFVRRIEREGAGLAWPFLAMAAAEASRPLVANFAIDRIGDAPLSTIAAAGAVAADGLGAILGLLLALLLGGRWSKAITLFAMSAAGVALGATYFVHDAMPFALIVFVTGFGLWTAVWTVLLAEGAAARRPWRAALVFLAAGAAGPIVGSLLAEAEGRRMAFATIGVVVVIVGLASIASASRTPQRVRTRLDLLAPSSPGALALAEAITLVAAAFPVFAWADIQTSGIAMRENYATIGLQFGLVGVASLLAPALAVRAAPAVGAALGALALAGACLVALPAPITSIAVGLGLGLTMLSLGARAFAPPAAMTIAFAMVLSAASHATTYLTGLSSIGSATLAAAVLGGASLLAAIRPAGRRRRR
ncbi:hypothetical protein [Acuticoccus mangrovi]|uniref:Uncharacterized protein n=1 Tax=Acuticoccus mangrovi TaxID=2796142 RepID=A0A934IJW1_9HYPH|nr:hypothetical protein [Acuticoccus mangrovi]MBJ3776341.1 hypothetical protein [Acuticoccus mangrovi]